MSEPGASVARPYPPTATTQSRSAVEGRSSGYTYRTT